MALETKCSQWLRRSDEISARCATTRRTCDAVVASMVARAAAVGLCEPIPGSCVECAQSEGWIRETSFRPQFPLKSESAPVILVDTHVVVWLAFDQDQLSRKARTAINDSRKNAAALAISDITLLELATLASKDRIHLDISLESFCRRSSLGSLFYP